MNELFESEFFTRKGTFTVNTSALREEELPAVLEAFSKVFICKCSSDFMSGKSIYKGYSSEFESVPKGAIVPKYRLVFENRGDLGIHFSRFEKA